MIRPRMFSVASVVWLYLGPAWILFGGFGLYIYHWVGSFNASAARVSSVSPPPEAEVPLVFLWFPGVALVLGALGLIGALSLLKSKETGRRMVQLTCYGAALLLLAFTVNWMMSVTSTSRSYYSSTSWEQVKMALMGLLCGVLTALPFIVLARKLGSPELRMQTK